MSALATLRLGLKAVQTSSTTTGKIMKGLGKIAKNIGEFFTEGFQTAQKEVGDLLNWLGEKWEGIKEKFHEPIIFDRSLADMLNFILEKLGDLKDGATSVYESGVKQLDDWGESWSKFKKDSIDPIFDFFSQFTFSNLQKQWNGFIDFVLTKYRNSGLAAIVDNLRFVYDTAVEFKGDVESAIGGGGKGSLLDKTAVGHTINVYNDIKAGETYGSKKEMAKAIAGSMPGLLGMAVRNI